MVTKLLTKHKLGKGPIGFTVMNSYSLPAAKIWDAITQGKHVQHYFVDKVEGDFTPKLTPVTWEWKDWGRFTLWPTAYRKGKMLEFRWLNSQQSYLTRVTFVLKRKGKLVGFEISERGWSKAHIKNAFDNCSGWSSFQDYLKAYLLKGLDLRTK